MKNEKKIENYLRDNEVPVTLNGFIYLTEGIKFFMEREDAIIYRNTVYSEIAKKYEINIASVISSINYALKKSKMKKMPLLNLLIISAKELEE